MALFRISINSRMWSKAAIWEYRANPQYRKTRRAKGLGTPACAQCARMREQEPKVLETETLDSKMLRFQHNTILHLKMWCSGATARPPGQVACVQAYHPWWGYGAHAHAISASLQTSLDERGFLPAHDLFSQPVSSYFLLHTSICQQHQTLIRCPENTQKIAMHLDIRTHNRYGYRRRLNTSSLSSERRPLAIIMPLLCLSSSDAIAISFLSYKLHWKYNPFPTCSP